MSLARFLALLSLVLIISIADKSPALAAAPEDPRRYALVIANVDYGGSSQPGGSAATPPLSGLRYMSDLPASVSDGEKIGKVFKEAGYEIDFVPNADRAAMLAAIERFNAIAGKASLDAHLVFYYSGHSVQLEHTVYLIPARALIRDVEDFDYLKSKEATEGLIPVTALKFDKVGATAHGVSLVILDSCRENPWPGLGGRGVPNSLFYLGPTAAPRPTTPSNPLLANYAPVVGDGFPTKPEFTYLALAAAPGSYAAADDDQSVFTRALLKHLRRSSATLPEIFNDVGYDVAIETRSKTEPEAAQLPHFYGPAFHMACLGTCDRALSSSYRSALPPTVPDAIRASVLAARHAADLAHEAASMGAATASKASDAPLHDESDNSYEVYGSNVRSGVGRFENSFFEYRDKQYRGDIRNGRPHGLGEFKWYCSVVFLRSRCPINPPFQYRGRMAKGLTIGHGVFHSFLNGGEVYGDFTSRGEGAARDSQFDLPLLILGQIYLPDGTMSEGLFSQNKLIEGITWRDYGRSMTIVAPTRSLP